MFRAITSGSSSTSPPINSLVPSSSTVGTIATVNPKDQERLALVHEALQDLRSELETDQIHFIKAYDALPEHAHGRKPFIPKIEFEMNGSQYSLWKNSRDHFQLKRLNSDQNPLILEFSTYWYGNTFDVSTPTGSAHLSKQQDPNLAEQAQKLEMDILLALKRTMPKGLLSQTNLIA